MEIDLSKTKRARKLRGGGPNEKEATGTGKKKSKGAEYALVTIQEGRQQAKKAGTSREGVEPETPP